MIEFFLIFIGLPVLFIVVLNYKELLGIWKRPSQQLPPAIEEDENRAKSRRNAAYGAVGATIAIGSILLDAHNDHQRMLDVDRRK